MYNRPILKHEHNRMALSIVILAAGRGKRMHSQLPKVLHRLAGKPLLERVAGTALELHPASAPIVIFGHQGEQIREALTHLPVNWVEQLEQLGTGHAAQQALPHLSANDRVLVLYGDVPLISVETLQHFIQETPELALGLITTHLTNPTGFGRIIRDAAGNLSHIVEEKDATPAERAIQEVNPGIYLVPVACLQRWLPQLKNTNAQGEYYLTDILHLATQEKMAVHTSQPKHHEEILGINDRAQLATLERFYQRSMAEKLMLQGVTLADPNRFDLRGELTVGRDVTIDVNVIIEGNVSIGNNCIIGPNTVLRNTLIADHTEIKANCFIEGAEIGDHCIVGPFARIRPGTVLMSQAHVGNFAEIKNSLIGHASKVHHVSYIGDCEIGKNVNIGAGTITCNYDGANKHRTVIGDNAFIGSNTELVAPVTIGEGATIGAGSTITRNAPANQLTLSRTKQSTIEGWQRKKKEET